MGDFKINVDSLASCFADADEVQRIIVDGVEIWSSKLPPYIYLAGAASSAYRTLYKIDPTDMSIIDSVYNGSMYYNSDIVRVLEKDEVWWAGSVTVATLVYNEDLSSILYTYGFGSTDRGPEELFETTSYVIGQYTSTSPGSWWRMFDKYTGELVQTFNTSSQSTHNIVFEHPDTGCLYRDGNYYNTLTAINTYDIFTKDLYPFYKNQYQSIVGRKVVSLYKYGFDYDLIVTDIDTGSQTTLAVDVHFRYLGVDNTYVYGYEYYDDELIKFNISTGVKTVLATNVPASSQWCYDDDYMYLYAHDGVSAYRIYQYAKDTGNLIQSLDVNNILGGSDSNMAWTVR